MRFEDWDVLLFNGPSSDIGHIPLKEFKTQCHAYRDAEMAAGEVTHQNATGPLMTCFTPSIDENLPFQISIHSWVPKQWFYGPVDGTHGDRQTPTQLWQVKVNVDGYDACIEHYPQDVAWPKVITTANLFKSEPNGDMQPLRFPRFYKSVMSQHHWDANDCKGRIKIEISEGYATTENGKQGFVKLMNHATFNFQPAPLEVLQRAAIAWPNAAIFKNPIRSDAPPPFGHGPAFANRAMHQRDMSASSIASIQSSPSSFGLGPPSSFNYAPGLVPPNSYANSSRSSSAYSTIPITALPLPAAATAAAARSPVYPANAGLQDHVQLRIPSDQLEKILTVLATPKATNMPPPPLPQHAVAATQINGNEVSSTAERRLANCSDVSMHPDCDSFPACTTKDSEGRIVHDPPAKGVRSKKEGVVDNHNRDFFSHVLNPASTDSPTGASQPSSSPAKKNPLTSSSPGVGSARKRTRSETKASEDKTGSPDKETSKPARKLRRAVTAGAEGR